MRACINKSKIDIPVWSYYSCILFLNNGAITICKQAYEQNKLQEIGIPSSKLVTVINTLPPRPHASHLSLKTFIFDPLKLFPHFPEFLENF